MAMDMLLGAHLVFIDFLFFIFYFSCLFLPRWSHLPTPQGFFSHFVRVGGWWGVGDGGGGGGAGGGLININ